ncbi:RagB/SusD family nutrient uptake outer membrane protein [Aquimarina agarilytica]|uniref:RagB/SusD family nutrient uptake outer membrane protein n=1 Tax=Aquimarina agarilytica TaxID=1087449 RepID=UPI0002881DD5|nr:RagB/SusD family nutrient uptake outer membrane protein [Aquimarina agarilytica]
MNFSCLFKKALLPFLILVLFTQCTDDESETSLKETGSIEFYTFFKNIETIIPIPDQSVLLTPTDLKLKTNEEGIALFDNIPIGKYTLNLLDLNNEIFKTIEVLVKKDEKSSVTYDSAPKENPISPIANTLERLKKNYKFAYSTFEEIYNTHYLPILNDVGSDIIHYGFLQNSQSDIDNYKMTSKNTTIEDIWDLHYKSLWTTQHYIELANKVETTETDEKNNILGELHALRAIAHFNLVKLYGNPILITNNITTIDELEKPKTNSSTSDVYELIIEDLIFAQKNIAPSTRKPNLSIDAATAILGKVYLQSAGFPLNKSENYQLALNELNKLKGKYNLEKNYADVFAPTNEQSNTETIFSISYDKSTGTTESFFGNKFIGPKGLVDINITFTEPSFISSFLNIEVSIDSEITTPITIKDSRFAQNIATYTYSNGIKESSFIRDWRPNKYLPQTLAENGNLAKGVDFPYLRYADVLLMIAEAENAINGPTQIAKDAINEVRTRAYGDSSNNISNTITKDEFLLEVIEERRKELCYEGHRRDDLIRTNLLASVIEKVNLQKTEKRDFDTHESIWPIPEKEILLNPTLIQNPNY